MQCSYLAMRFKKELIKDITRPKSSAATIPVTVKPATNFAANRIKPTLITKEKSPKVSIVIGKVRMTSIGFTKTLRTPKTIATITAVVAESKETFGSK